MDSKKNMHIILLCISCLFGLTSITHYIITQIPDSLSANIDLHDVNAFDPATGITPLMQAAIDSDIERAKLLIAGGAHVNIRSANSDRDYAINYALINGGKLGSLAVAQLLIGSGADLNVTNARGMAPIHMMMLVTNFDNRTQILKMLMDHGAHINAQNEDGSTMLHITVTMNDIDWISHLNKEYGQIINYDLRDKKGRTPLDLAIELGHVSVNNADSIENELRKRPVYIGDNFDVNATDGYGRNGLQLAVLRSDMKFVQALISRGAPLTHQDSSGNTALHNAVTTIDPLKYTSYLLQHGAPTNIINKNGQTPIFMVMRIDSPTVRLSVAKKLIEVGSPLVNKDNHGKSLLDLAQEKGDSNLYTLIRTSIESRK